MISEQRKKEIQEAIKGKPWTERISMLQEEKEQMTERNMDSYIAAHAELILLFDV